MSDKQILVHLTQEKDYRFQVAFEDGVPELTVDEPPPLGSATGPSPVQLLTAAVGSCLSDSLLFALRKFKQRALSLCVARCAPMWGAIPRGGCECCA